MRDEGGKRDRWQRKRRTTEIEGMEWSKKQRANKGGRVRKSDRRRKNGRE